jgi:hypothetical protein
MPRKEVNAMDVLFKAHFELLLESFVAGKDSAMKYSATRLKALYQELEIRDAIKRQE